MRQTAPVLEPGYEVLALFTASIMGASMLLMSTGTLLPFLEDSLHITRSQLGMVMSAQMLGGLLLTAVCGAMTDRFGDRVVVFWSGLFMGLSLIAAGLVHDFTWVMFWLVMYGLGYAAVAPSGIHAMLFFFKKQSRGFAESLTQCGVPMSGVLGSLALPAVAARAGYQWAFIAAGVVALIACTTAAWLYREPLQLRGRRAPLKTLLAGMLAASTDVRLVLITLTATLLLCAQVGVMAFFALSLVREAGYSIAAAVSIFSLMQVAAIGGRLFWGWASDHLFGGSRTAPLALVCVVSCIAAAAFSFVSHNVPPFAAVAIGLLFGFSAEGYTGLAMIAMAETGGQARSGSALGVGVTVTYVAGVLGPVIFGAVAQTYDYAAMWRVIAVLQVCAIAPALLAHAIARRKVPAKV